MFDREGIGVVFTVLPGCQRMRLLVISASKVLLELSTDRGRCVGQYAESPGLPCLLEGGILRTRSTSCRRCLHLVNYTAMKT